MSTTAFITQCSHCQKKIKLADRKLIGKSAKCPACQQKFVIQESSVSAPLTKPQPVVKKPVEEEKTPVKNNVVIPPVAESKPAAQENEFTDFNFEKPLFSEPLNFAPPAESTSEETAFPDFTKPKAASTAEFDFNELPAENNVLLSNQSLKKKSILPKILLGISLLVILGGGGWYVNQLMNIKPQEIQQSKIVVTEDYKMHVKEKVDKLKLVQDVIPVKGENLNLHLLPAGVRVVAHLRVADIFGEKTEWQELRASLGPLAEWLKTQIESYSHFKVEEIDHILFGIVLGSRGTPPEVASVVYLRQPVNLADTLINFNVAPLPDLGTDVYGNNQFAFLMVNPQTFAFTTPALISDLVNFRHSNAISTDGLTELVTKASSNSHVVVAFENDDLAQQIPYIFPVNLQPALTKWSEWFGNDAETTLCTFQLEEPFFAQMIVRNKAAAKPAALERTLQKNLERLPQDVLALTKFMRPGQIGFQHLIGRLPAMLKVLSMCTVTCTDKQNVQLVTMMPLKAAPNLAAASLLAWDESTRTSFLLAENKPQAPVQEGPKKNLPATMAERMKVKIDVEFNRVPLQDAFAFIANEIEVKLDIDGDSLKAGGYTKNMPQTFSMKQTTVAEICQKIVGQYNQTEIMCIAIDEKTKTLFVFTESVAKAKGMAVYK